MHEGPRSLALQADDDPGRAALVPQLNSSGSAVLQYTGRIAYSKGAAVVAMLEAYFEALLPDSFQVALPCFLFPRASRLNPMAKPGLPASSLQERAGRNAFSSAWSPDAQYM